MDRVCQITYVVMETGLASPAVATASRNSP